MLDVKMKMLIPLGSENANALILQPDRKTQRPQNVPSTIKKVLKGDIDLLL
jgi:hypothetical protein